MRKTSSLGWDKKFQLYFGTAMRVNYGPGGEAATFLASAAPDRWYALRVEMDLANEQLDLWLDGTRVLSDIPMHPGPITDLEISGWDRPGAVFLDELIGFAQQGTGPGEAACAASMFDAGDEGWRITGDAQGSSPFPDWSPTGGNPGGHVYATDDVVGGVWHWQAPAAYLGDKSTSYSQTLTFDLKQSQTDSPFSWPDVRLEGAGLALTYRLPAHPGAEWTSYAVPLSESVGWMVADAGRAPTQGEM
ncbi:MAG: hypothetical protein GTO03_02775, partial [Planctomycetales bacterium]|nr:hypothetical protein [Planctomycetales bacterium]